jgi:tRNA A58 N-methylase Trm61
MLGAGDLLIESASEDGQQLFSDIRDPEQVLNIIHEAINASTKRNINVDPIVGQLERLEAMLNRGSITQSEFDEQKRRLIN